MARSRKQKKIGIRLNWRLAVAIGAILAFIAAFIYYFASTFIVTEREYAVYTSMEEPTLPIIYAEAENRKINMMHGYLQDMGSSASSDCITPLPADRKLKLDIKLFEGSISSIRYEIRSLDLEHFIEKTELKDFNKLENGEVEAVLPIQNMIEKNTQYLLKIQLDLGEKTVNYYTKIIWTESSEIFDMINTAADFTQKSFDYDQAKDLIVYLETDSNSETDTLGTVGLKSGFSQVTWSDTGMSLSSELNISVKEYDGIMGAVEVSYISESDSGAAQKDRYFNKDEFTMKSGSERIYMMNFERKTNQIFEGNKHLFTGNRINLGIINSEEIQTKLSENEKYIAFKSGRELWLYDQEGKNAVNIFSFRSENDSVRADYDMHNIKILSVDDDGGVDFVVYGYMNRGRHEGYNGIIYYRYKNTDRSLSELFFIPRSCTYEKIKSELDELVIKADTGMVYLKQDDSVVAIDLASLETLDVITDIYGDNYAISRNQKILAWTENAGNEKNTIKLMDLDTGMTKTITADEGETISVVAFYEQDLIYGISNYNDKWLINGRYRGRPMRKLKIVNKDLTEIMNYEKEGLYFEDIAIDGDRIQIAQYRKGEGEGAYQFASRDTIVSSISSEADNEDHVLSDVSEKKKKIYYINLDENIKTTRTLNVDTPKAISYEKSGVLELIPHKSTVKTRYYAYSNGRLTGAAYSLKEAINQCYDEMGWVEDENASILYSRCDRVNSKVIQEPFNAAQPLVMALEADFKADRLTSDGYFVMDAQGTALNRLLYYVGKGYPVLAYTQNKGYCLIYGYTADSVELYYPAADENGSPEKSKMTMDEAAVYFGRYQDDFIVFIHYPGK